MTDAPHPISSSKTDDAVNDPRGLIAEAYRMPDLFPAAARTIFFDWAMGKLGAEGRPEAIAALHARYSALAPDHPMTAVLAEGLADAARAPVRRGGAAARRV